MIQKLSSSPRSWLTFSVFAVFGTALILMHDLIWLYHDDFGYATLSYTTTIEGIEGQDFNQINLLAFLRNEYMNWTGRVLPFFIEANSFKVGLPFTRFIQALVILIVTWMTAKLTTKTELFPLTAAAIILYFLTLPVFIAAGGIFWFSASISYLWGLPFLLYGAYRLQTDGRFTWKAVAAFALAALFQEQVAIACLTIAGLFALQALLKDKTVKAFFTLGVTTLPILLTSVFILFSPGNFNRKSVSKYPVDGERSTADINLEKIADTLLSPVGKRGWENDSAIWLTLLGLSFAALLIAALYQRRKAMLAAITGLALITSLSLALEWPEYNILLCLVAGYGICLFAIQKQRGESYIIGYVYIAAVLTLALLLMSPTIAGRQYIPFFVLMAVPVGYSFAIAASSKHTAITAAAVLALSPVALEQSVDIYAEYAKNDIFMEANDKALRQASLQIKSGDIVPSITLTKLPNSRFAELMPYQRPKIDKWLRRFYSLPNEVELRWQGPPQNPDETPS